MAELGWFPVYVDRWINSAEISAMVPEQEGAYWRLLLIAWGDGTREPRLEDNEAKLAAQSRLGARWKRLGALVREQFEARDGYLVNAVQLEVWREQQSKHAVAIARASAGGEARAAAEKRRKRASSTTQAAAEKRRKRASSTTQAAAEKRRKRASSTTQAEPKSSELEVEVETTTTTATTSRRKKRVGGDEPRVTWLSPTCAVWEAKFGAGSFASVAGQAAKVLGPMYKAGVDITAPLQFYLDATDAQFVSLTRFAQTYSQWAPKAGTDERGFLTQAGINALSD